MRRPFHFVVQRRNRTMTHPIDSPAPVLSDPRKLLLSVGVLTLAADRLLYGILPGVGLGLFFAAVWAAVYWNRERRGFEARDGLLLALMAATCVQTAGSSLACQWRGAVSPHCVWDGALAASGTAPVLAAGRGGLSADVSSTLGGRAGVSVGLVSAAGGTGRCGDPVGAGRETLAADGASGAGDWVSVCGVLGNGQCGSWGGDGEGVLGAGSNDRADRATVASAGGVLGNGWGVDAWLAGGTPASTASESRGGGAVSGGGGAIRSRSAHSADALGASDRQSAVLCRQCRRCAVSLGRSGVAGRIHAQRVCAFGGAQSHRQRAAGLGGASVSLSSVVDGDGSAVSEGPGDRLDCAEYLPRGKCGAASADVRGGLSTDGATGECCAVSSRGIDRLCIAGGADLEGPYLCLADGSEPAVTVHDGVLAAVFRRARVRGAVEL